MKRLLLDGPELRRDIPPAPVTRAEPVVRLRSGLTLDDRSCWQYPTMLVGSVGSGKSTLLDQIQQPVLAHAAKAGDAVVILLQSRMFCVTAGRGIRSSLFLHQTPAADGIFLQNSTMRQTPC